MSCTDDSPLRDASAFAGSVAGSMAPPKRKYAAPTGEKPGSCLVKERDVLPEDRGRPRAGQEGEVRVRTRRAREVGLGHGIRNAVRR